MTVRVGVRDWPGPAGLEGQHRARVIRGVADGALRAGQAGDLSAAGREGLRVNRHRRTPSRRRRGRAGGPHSRHACVPGGGGARGGGDGRNRLMVVHHDQGAGHPGHAEDRHRGYRGQQPGAAGTAVAGISQRVAGDRRPTAVSGPSSSSSSTRGAARVPAPPAPWPAPPWPVLPWPVLPLPVLPWPVLPAAAVGPDASPPDADPAGRDGMCHSPGVEIRSSAGGVVQEGWGAHSIRSLGGDGRALGGDGPLGGRGRRQADHGMEAGHRRVRAVAGQVVAGAP